ncbi:hypothetical protein NDU88_001074 [Pleurodeles waltl]|uniref:Uncharacterized protein n=1 Tax=Pleurodeles waltl TaxID=8319 RepID=A0AAV7VZ15_PLEWA|nr:hypothetical protein NDU88_001074 [Pleurodeles waltl]
MHLSTYAYDHDSFRYKQLPDCNNFLLFLIGEVTVGQRSENCLKDSVTFFDGSCSESGGASGMIGGETSEMDDINVNELEESLNHAQSVDGCNREMDDINASEHEESLNHIQRETAKVGKNRDALQEKFSDKLPKSKRMINKPKYLEDFVLD